MKLVKSTAFALSALFAGFATQAGATVLTFDLTDTPQPNLGDGGFYEFTGGNPRFDTYSFEQNGADVQLRFDDEANTAQINGVGYNTDTGELASFNLFYDDATLNGNTLSLNDMDAVGSVGVQTVYGKGFNLSLLGDSLTGDGWLVDRNGGHFGDFHLAGTQIDNGACTGIGCNNGGGEVPAPAPLTLIGAMALLGAWRRRRANAA
jgi:MYXO-CTERM domain-containing protein